MIRLPWSILSTAQHRIFYNTIRPLRRRTYVSSTAKQHSEESNPRQGVLRFIPAPRPVLRGVFKGVTFLLTGHVFICYFYSMVACEGISMLPTFNSYGDWVVVSKYYRRGRAIQVGDVVSFKHPVDEETRAIKRVLGMPGDIVCRDTPGVGERLIQIPEGHCWVVGDNLAHSRDSRLFGPLPLALVRGKVIWRIPTSPRWSWPESMENALHPREDEDDVD